MITLIGVGHVFAISEQVKELIRSRRPDVVCLELDPSRFRALTEKGTRRNAPLQYMLLAQIQRRIADKFGSEAGDEMLAAASAAGEVGAKIALIDMDATMVFSRLWRVMSFREKLGIFSGALIGLVASKEKVEREVERYEDNEAGYLEVLGEQFPSVKRVLLDERNRHMADRIASIASQHENIVAVIGDGHLSAIVEALGDRQVESVRLRDIRHTDPRAQASGGQYSVSYYLK